jgi:superfamily II helicase
MRRSRDLRKYGLPDTLLGIWEQQQGEFLLPVQETAVQRYGLFEGRSLVISSPTSLVLLCQFGSWALRCCDTML